jgi:hypothetical protein
LEVRTLSAHEYSIWDKLVEDSPNGTVFHKSYWLTACSKSLNAPLKIYGCFDNGSLLAGCSLFASRRLFRRAEGTAGMTPYGGFLLGKLQGDDVRKSENAYMRAVSCLNEAIAKDGFSYVHILSSPELVDVRPFAGNGWESAVHYTYYFDFQGDVEKRISRDAMKFARRAIKKDIAVRRLQVPDVAKYYQLFQVTFERQNLAPPVPMHFFEAIVEGLRDKGVLEMWIAETLSGEPAAANIVVWDSKKAHGWSSASDPSYLHTGASTLLLCEIFKSLAVRGFRTIDIRGADMPHIANYLANFNPRLLPCYSLEKKAKWLRMLGHIRTFLREFVPT